MLIQTDPFFHLVIDNFFDTETALKLSQEFFSYDDPRWFHYNNPIEKKKTINHWNYFPATTYKEFARLCSEQYISHIETITGIQGLLPDIGLHGGGWHIHGTGDKLNIHKDYSIHPKLHLLRKLNLIVYLTPDWQAEWGGALELWSHNTEIDRPLACCAKIDCLFNRAVLFDTTQNSWHGLPDAIKCPVGITRRSMAVYYLTNAESTDNRYRALFVPTREQESDSDVEKLCQERSK